MPFLRKALDTPFGAMPHGPVLRVGSYYKDSSAAAIYPGDFVILESDSGVAPSGTSSNALIGVAAMYSPASTEENNFLVYDHPMQEFVVQDDNDTTAMTRTSEGFRCDLVTTTGNTSTLRSNHELDSSSAAVTSTLPIQIVRLHPLEESSYASAAATNGQRKWIVKIADHAFMPYTIADSVVA